MTADATLPASDDLTPKRVTREETRMPERETDAERFWRSVDKSSPDGCWLWQGSGTPNGYGQFRVIRDGKSRNTLVHRFAYEMDGAPIAAGMSVDHMCRNRRCVRRDHLRLASTKQNAENLSSSGRGNSGARNVYWHKKTSKWHVQVTHQGKAHSAGYFARFEDAESAAKQLRLRLFTHNDADQEVRA